MTAQTTVLAYTTTTPEVPIVCAFDFGMGECTDQGVRETTRKDCGCVEVLCPDCQEAFVCRFTCPSCGT